MSSQKLNSYFVNVVYSRQKSLGKQYYSGVALRDSDFSILQQQNPIGWAFFDKRNVEYLLKRVQDYRIGTNLKTIEFADIANDMVFVYETEASESVNTMSQQTPMVHMLNQKFLQMFEQKQAIKQQQILNYNKLLAQPNRSAYRTTPINDRIEKTVYIDQRNSIL